MAKSAMNRQPAQTSASIDLDAGLADIAAMNVEQLRELWRQKRGQEPPAAFSKDLIARALAYWLQEEVLGALDARVRKLLGASSRGEGPPARHVKVGSVIVREYQGKLHEVLMVNANWLATNSSGRFIPTKRKRILFHDRQDIP
jgi:Protein of unknown function (DUF2924)